ncbi:UTP4, CIRH1A [Ceraceosorus bombacis]|uniref:UTP4, CIRH1A n=1 Tax=Ceraceosorus bombacis TaxID=401625 RepID=A0A0P1BAI7_9BASI|nr:UTP4, CIRH1A [Ceraceosorus bombacis]
MSLDVEMADGEAETASSSAAKGQQQQRGLVASSSTSSSSNTLAVHRTRFLDWSPSSITALAFSPSLPHHSLHVRPVLAIGRDNVLAIGRDNGNIDICTWVSENSGGDGDGAARDSSGNAKSWIVDSVSAE